MTQDEIIELAHQASKEWLKELPTPWETANQVPKRFLEIFAKLVEERAAAKEREACAVLAEEHFCGCGRGNCLKEDVRAHEIARLIRAKGEI